MAEATLDVTGVQVVGFPVDTTITTTGGTYTIAARTWLGVPRGLTSMTVDPVGDAMCMLLGKDRERGRKEFIQVMTVDEVRTSVAV